MASTLPEVGAGLMAFLEPLRVDRERVYTMSREFSSTFTRLAAESTDQFLPTPISESILLPLSTTKKNQGRYLAIDIGGTNLRVGFIELLGDDEVAADLSVQANGRPVGKAAEAPSVQAPRGAAAAQAAQAVQTVQQTQETQATEASLVPQNPPRPSPPPLSHQQHSLAPVTDSQETGQPKYKPRLRRLHERSWSIQEHLKSENADSLFAWIGSCIASVVREGCNSFGLPADVALPMGVTFSFPMEQETLSAAKLMAMGKGFAITSQLDLGSHLVKGYEKTRADSEDFVLPPITVAAIANDAVSTLVSFVYEVPSQANQKAAMGIICGTGSNATLLLKRSKLHPSKWARKVSLKDNDPGGQVRIAVNTEWSINGSAPAMRAVNLISQWDEQLSQSVEYPGFQPLEYMTAGRYLGELGRIMLVDYMTRILGIRESSIPSKFLRRFEPHNTTFLSRFRPGEAQPLLAMLEAEFRTDGAKMNGNAHANGLSNGYANGGLAQFHWTDEIAEALYHIAKAIETRAAAIIAAAIVGLLDCAEELPPAPVPPPAAPAVNGGRAAASRERLELVVGYTGGCITNFQDYLADCQAFLDDLVDQHYGGAEAAPVRIVLSPCHDGGIKGAGILVPAALASGGNEA